jgi:hypothetical protein
VESIREYSSKARIAFDRFRQGLAVDPEEIDANYVRRSDAELLWKENPVKPRMNTTESE